MASTMVNSDVTSATEGSTVDLDETTTPDYDFEDIIYDAQDNLDILETNTEAEELISVNFNF